MKWIDNIVYCFIFFIWFLFSLLPLRIHYILSDCIYYILYYLVGYRRKVVRKNLISCFPDKSLGELVKLEKEFYSYFCDYIVETVKMITISKKNMKKRMKFFNVEEVQASIDAGSSCSLYLGHYGNWEWVSSIAMHLERVHCGQIYHALENKYFDRLFLYIRGRFGGTNIERADTLKVIGKWHKKNEVSIIGYIADQVPSYKSMHYWTEFLNHDTPMFTGAERISRIVDTAVYYLEISRPKRGYYEGRFIKITDVAHKLPKFEITERYARLLEKNIIDYPSYWLWSHNRWKRDRDGFNREFSEEERKRILSKL